MDFKSKRKIFNFGAFASLFILLMFFLISCAENKNLNPSSSRVSDPSKIIDGISSDRRDSTEFHMAFMSDPQLWDDGDHRYDNSVSMKNSILRFQDQVGRDFFEGVIINGDLTQDGNDIEWSQFEDIFIKDQPFDLFLGLGNHDYYEVARGGDAVDMGLRLVESVERNPATRHSDLDYRTIRFNDQDTRHYGSLSYSWDRGPFHFIQLHGAPNITHKAIRTVGRGHKKKKETFHYEHSYEWLQRDLEANTGKFVVLNLHDIFEVMSDEGGRLVLHDERLKEIIQSHPNIRAVFGGHYHGWIGHLGTIAIPGRQEGNMVRRGFNIEWFQCGSSELQKYLIVTFRSSNVTQPEMSVYTVDSSDRNADPEPGFNYTVTNR